MSRAENSSSRPAALPCIPTKQSAAPCNHKAIKHLMWCRIQQEYWSKQCTVPLGFFFFSGACGSVLSLKFNDVRADGWKYYLSVYQHIKLDFPFPFLFHSKMLFIFMLISERKIAALSTSGNICKR